MAAIMGLRDATSVAAAATSAGVGSIAAVSTSAAAFDATIAGLPYSPAKEKAASRGLGYPSRTSLALLLLRSRKLAGPAKARVLLVACVLLALFLVCRQVGPLIGWNYQISSSISSPSRGGYTVLINTWKRNSLLKRSVAHYASCLWVGAIHIVWSESDPPSDSLKAYLSKIVFSQSQSAHKPNFRFELNEEDNLNNRFKPIGDLKNDAIFSVDDDVIVPCPTLDFAFAVWQSSPDTMVGFVPRMHLLAEENGMPYYRYGGWWSVWWMGTYSMVLSKAAFFHRKYLGLYTYKMSSSIHEYVTRERNCEDIAMSLLVANATRAPPIWVKGELSVHYVPKYKMQSLLGSHLIVCELVSSFSFQLIGCFCWPRISEIVHVLLKIVQGKIYEIGGSGISSLKGHNRRRNKCLNDFFSLYGAVPLVPTSMKAVDAQEEWFW